LSWGCRSDGGFAQPMASTRADATLAHVNGSWLRRYRPEFLNRIDEIIMFSKLSKEQMVPIVDLQMKEIRDRLEEHGLKVELSEQARSWFAAEGYSEDFGARPLRRLLLKLVESPLSISILSGEFSEGDTIIVDVNEENKIVFTTANVSQRKPRKKAARNSQPAAAKPAAGE